MTFFITIALVIFTLGISTPLAGTARRLVRFPSESSCNIISFTQHIGGQTQSFKEEVYQRCQHIPVDVPTTIYLDRDNRGCKYEALGFSGSDCGRDGNSQSLRFTIHPWRPQVTLNADESKRSTCSFRLVDRPLGTARISFSGGGYRNTAFNVNHLDCNNVCASHGERYYPTRVSLIVNGASFSNAVNGVSFSNAIELFSEPNCAGIPYKPHSDGTIGTPGQIHSYMIVKSR